MAERIRAHRERHGGGWETIEEPLDLAGALELHARADRPILVDCLTPWLSNLMAAGRDIEAETRMLIERLRALTGKLTRSSGNDLQPFHRVPPHPS
jgi:adenosylcobinamide kinase / adenosylcobinamide-phosphate guanylyltransferase